MRPAPFTNPSCASCWPLARLGLYIVLFAAVLETVVLVQRKHPSDNFLFLEGGIVEWTQVGLLLTCSLLLLVSSLRTATFRDLHRLMALFPLLAAVRELDHRFDNLFGKGVWGWVAIFLGTVGLLFAFLRRRQVWEQLLHLLPQRSFGFLASAVFFAPVLSTAFGQKVFWKGLLSEAKYTRDVPRVVEEAGELAGYLFLLFAVCEVYLSRNETPMMQSPQAERRPAQEPIEEEELELAAAGSRED